MIGPKLSQPPLAPVRSNRYAGYETVDKGDQGGNVAEPRDRGRSWWTIAAFTLIIAVNIGDGIDDGFSVWNWILIALGVVFIVQAASRLRT